MSPTSSGHTGDRRRQVAMAGHLGDVATATEGLGDGEPVVRATALEALARIGILTPTHLATAMSDPSPVVRARAAELVVRVVEPPATLPTEPPAGLPGASPAGLPGESPAGLPGPSPAAPDPGRSDPVPDLATRLVGLLHDPIDAVVEAASFGLGELGDDLVGRHDVIDGLAATAGRHQDPLCRETAIAALGAIGDPAGAEAVLAAMTDKPAVRRRAVLALSAFDGPAVEAALEAALDDRDWQVRQAAEDLTDRRR